ncbi:MAG TPA: thiamine-phosphate kinase [bacterium]|nr:thiamine-phosphate kinase [bacterium]
MTDGGDASGTNGEAKRPSDLAALSEDGLIRRIRRAAESEDPRIIRNIGDDAAVVAAAEKTVVTTDLLIEDVHFKLSTSPPKLLGRKAMAVNLSDLAAMGAVPRFAFLGLAAPGNFSAAMMDEIMAGFIGRGQEAAVTLTGGDVCRADKLVLAVTLIGDAEPPAPVYRSGARPRDLVFVTGTVGDSALGLLRLGELGEPVTMEMIESDPLRYPILRHLDPPARLEAGLRLAAAARSMMDLSDGIMKDLPRLLLESGGLGAVIETALLPLSAPFKERFQVKAAPEGRALACAAAGGEDYELIFTASSDVEAAISRIAERTGLAITRIGEVRQEPGLVLIGPDGDEVAPPAMLFEHFVPQAR